MSSTPLARFLAQIDPHTTPLEPPPQPVAMTFVPVDPVHEQYEARLAQALMDLRAEHERERAQTLAERDEQLAQMRAAWAESESERLAGLFNDGLQNLAQQLAAKVSAVLAPVIMTSIREKMVEDLSQALQRLLKSKGAMKIHLKGPADLIRSLCQRLPTDAKVFAIEDATRTDLEIKIDETVLETQIEAWGQTLSHRLAEKPLE